MTSTDKEELLPVVLDAVASVERGMGVEQIVDAILASDWYTGVLTLRQQRKDNLRAIAERDAEIAKLKPANDYLRERWS